MITIQPNSEGHIIELLRCRGKTYQRRWKKGYFVFDNANDIPLTKDGEVVCDVTQMCDEKALIHQYKVEDEIDILPNIDTSTPKFIENYNTLRYLIVGGYNSLTEQQ